MLMYKSIFQKKSKENPINVITNQMIFDFQDSLKELRGKNILKINNENSINYNKNDCKAIINLYKKNDQTWYLPNIVKKMLNSNGTFDEVNNKNLFITLKYVSLFCSLNSSQKNIVNINFLESLIIKYAYETNEVFGKNIEKSLTSDKKTVFKNIEFLREVIDKDVTNIFNKKYTLYQTAFEEVDNLLTNSQNLLNLSTLFCEFQILKAEVNPFLKNSKNLNSIVNEQNYNEFSEKQLFITDGIYGLLNWVEKSVSEQIVSGVTELDLKVNLSDLPPMTKSQWAGLGIRYLVLIFWAIVIIYPIFILVQQSFNANNSKVILDIQNFTFTTGTYKRLFEQTLYIRWLINSTIVAFLTMFFTIFIVSLTAYAFSRFKYKGKQAFLIALLVTQMIPTFTSLLVYYIMTELLKSSMSIPPIVTLIFIYTGGGVASQTVILKGYMDSISQDIDDAARIDGCSHFWIYLNIILPLCKPMIVLIALMSFIGPFGDVILPQLILKNQEDYTVAVGLNMFINSDRLMNYGGYFAGSTLVAIPIVVLFISLQKFVVSGLTTGGVKG